jgi:hypothetical protein
MPGSQFTPLSPPVLGRIPNRPKTSWSVIIFALASAAMCFGLLLAPLILQRYVYAPANRWVAGPIDDGKWFMFPAFAAWAYLFFCTLCRAARAQRLGKQHWRFKELIQLPYSGRLRPFTYTVLVCCLAPFTYGVSTYWYATRDGITISSSWPTDAAPYDWSGVTKRFVSCHRGRGGPIVLFRVQMRDGQTVDLASTQQIDFARHFATISTLTGDADTELGDLQYCPLFIRNFVNHLMETHPQ